MQRTFAQVLSQLVNFETNYSYKKCKIYDFEYVVSQVGSIEMKYSFRVKEDTKFMIFNTRKWQKKNTISACWNFYDLNDI